MSFLHFITNRFFAGSYSSMKTQKCTKHFDKIVVLEQKASKRGLEQGFLSFMGKEAFFLILGMNLHQDEGLKLF